MQVFTTPTAMRAWSRSARASGDTIAVVPTMGALHEGHLELIRQGASRCDRVVVTIFVNPLQFNQAADFDTYPRPIDDDLTRCDEIGVDAVFAPTASTMYPPGFETRVTPGDLAERLEGPMRPGHFEGVTTVVTKLFGATEPDVAMFGRKDYQQLAIISRMAADLDLGVEITGVPIVREPDGLALSSRNVRLTAEDRDAAVVLSRSLLAGRDLFDRGETDPDEIVALVTTAIVAAPRARLEYVELVDAETLTELRTVDRPAVLLTAAWFGDVRLIDNLILGEAPAERTQVS